MIRPVPGLSIEQQSSEWLLCACLWAEARGEGAVGMLAVAWVIFNRSQRYKWSVRETILKPLHFSCFNHDDPNRDKLLVAHTWDRFNWAAADTVVELFEDHRTTDPTMGSTHYYRPGTVQPEWGRGHPGWREKTVIGNHVFGVAD